MRVSSPCSLAIRASLSTHPCMLRKRRALFDGIVDYNKLNAELTETYARDCILLMQAMFMTRGMRLPQPFSVVSSLH